MSFWDVEIPDHVDTSLWPMSLVGFLPVLVPHLHDSVRRKTCGLRTRCGRCCNCLNDAWSDLWDRLLPEDKGWIIAHYAAVGLPASHAHPSLTEWILR